MKVCFSMDRFEELNLSMDSGYFLMMEAVKLNHQVYVCHGESLSLRGKVPYATYSVKVVESEDGEIKFHKTGEINLNHFDVILMRIDPEVNMDYITYTYILDFCQGLVLNPPSSLRNCPEKIWYMKEHATLPTLITQDLNDAQAFIQKQGKVVLKPLYMKAGELVRLVSWPVKNLKEMLNSYGSKVILQKYSEDRCSRVTVIKGEVVSHVEMQQVKGDFRHNIRLHQDMDSVELKRLSKENLPIMPLIQSLTEQGVFLAGIDMMGEYAIDVNITSPGALIHISKAEGKSMASIFWRKVEEEF